MSPSDVVTLANLDSKLASWQTDAGNHLYAIVDMGRQVYTFL